MSYKRIHTRIPVSARATLTCGDDIGIQARAMNISLDGIGLDEFSGDLEHSEYQIEVITEHFLYVRLNATLTHRDGHYAGFRTVITDEVSLKNIVQIYYQNSRQIENKFNN